MRGSRIQLRPQIGYGTSDERLTGGLGVMVGSGATQLSLAAERRVRDLSDLPVISPALNSLLSQEAGDDYGDYVLVNGAAAGLRHRLSGRTTVSLEVGVEESRSVAVSSTPATGRYRPNPALGAGTYRVGRVAFERTSGGIAVQHDVQGRLAVEGGEGPGEYLRVSGEGRWLTRAGSGQLLSRLYLGAGTDGLPALSELRPGWSRYPAG